MFRDAAHLDAKRTAGSLRSSLNKYFASRETWFDGTPASVDQRLAELKQILSHTTRASGRFRFADAAEYMVVTHHLEEDRRTLWAMKDALLNHTDPDPAPRPRGRLSAADQRTVQLQAQSFVAHQAGTYGDDLEELRARAANHIANQTSAMTRPRAQRIAAAFIDKVEELGRMVPKRTATKTAHFEDFDDPALYLQ